MTANSKTATRKPAARCRAETAARKRAERDACTVWRSCLDCGLSFPSEGVHNRLCSRCGVVREMKPVSATSISVDIRPQVDATQPRQ